MIRSRFVLLLILISVSRVASAQTVHPYERMTDPLAIARLDNPDFGPLSGNWGYGVSRVVDSFYPDYRVCAHDTGAGILTHLYATYRAPDTSVHYKLIVDG